MITPFVDRKVVVNGMSYGLSTCSYDVRIDSDVILGPNPAYMMQEFARSVLDNPEMEPSSDAIREMCRRFAYLPPSFALANTVEDFHMPPDVAAFVVDKSSRARLGISAFNTLMDPGFKGNLTLELVNHSSELVEIKAGDPICQIVFQLLDQPSETPYNGKYMNQPRGPQPAILEEVA